MSKFRALLVSSLLATALVGGAVTTSGASQADGPAKVMRTGTSWCC